MDAFLQTYWMELGIMGGLLFFSAFFSSSETALFSLSTADVAWHREKSGRVSQAIRVLTGNPSDFLSTVLFCNMVVNILMFSMSSSLSIQLDHTAGHGAALGFSLLTLALVITFGEITPKTIAVMYPGRVAMFSALPMLALHRALWIVRNILRHVSHAAERISTRGEDTDQRYRRRLKTILKAYMHKGVLLEHEGDMIREILDLPNMRIRECMQPRVDLLLIPATMSVKEAYDKAVAQQGGHVLVYQDHEDTIIGTLNLETLFLAQRDQPVSCIAARPLFLTEFHRANNVLQLLQQEACDLGVIVNEYGSLVGTVTTRDILEEIFGAIPDGEASMPEVEFVSENEYLLSGRLSIRNLRDLLGVGHKLSSSATVGGLVASELGCVPDKGDRVTIGRLCLHVESVHKRRITRVRLSVSEEGDAC